MKTVNDVRGISERALEREMDSKQSRREGVGSSVGPCLRVDHDRDTAHGRLARWRPRRVQVALRSAERWRERSVVCRYTNRRRELAQWRDGGGWRAGGALVRDDDDAAIALSLRVVSGKLALSGGRLRISDALLEVEVAEAASERGRQRLWAFAGRERRRAGRVWGEGLRVQ